MAPAPNAPSSAAAIWSAVAATAAAISAWLSFLLNRANRRDSARPELILSDWSTQSLREPLDRIKIGSIANVGQGAAFHIFLSLRSAAADLGEVTAAMFAEPIPVLAHGERRPIDARITVLWQNVAPSVGTAKWLPATLRILCHDTVGNIYETKYNFAVSPTIGIGGGHALAEGVMLMNRAVFRSSAGRRRIEGRIRNALDRVPLAKRLPWPKRWPN